MEGRILLGKNVENNVNNISEVFERQDYYRCKKPQPNPNEIPRPDTLESMPTWLDTSVLFKLISPSC